MKDPAKNEITLGFVNLLLGITTAAVVHWLILALRIPVLDAFPDWKYKLQPIPVFHAWIAMAFAALAAAVFVSFSKLDYRIKIAALILLGAALQFSFAYSKGRGLDGIRDRMVTLGHGEFANVAAEQTDSLSALRNYETLAKKKLYGHIPSKPPGTLLFYMLTERVSHALWHGSTTMERGDDLRTFASLTWPFVSYLVLIPLFLLARELTGNIETAILACLTYIAIPSVTLITLHTDQVIYPFLTVLPLLLAVSAVKKNNFWLAVLCGIATYAAVYFSFGLAVVAFLFPIPLFFMTGDNAPRPFAPALKWIGGIAAGWVFTDRLADVALNYDIFLRYKLAIEHHANWKAWENTLGTTLRFGLTNIAEFSAWIGLPIAILSLVCVGVAIHQLVNRNLGISSIYTAALTGVFIFLLVFGRTKGETPRLWLFLVP
ncbi:MAG: hypothetical protein DYG86_18510, partial [Chloroflexi bacterium CFX2]|nr:hypothetical protein [Chloroflexi bacterium CFX2]